MMYRKILAMDRAEIKKDLRKLLSKGRYEHTLGVEYTACCLAMRYGADLEQADLAGLLHDCAKYLSSDNKLLYSKLYNISVSEYERKNPELLHAKLGAYIAYDKYGVRDKEILSAIAWHTTGKPNMSLLEKIVFIADYIEPNRYKAEHLDMVRELAFQDIDQCLKQILTDTVFYLAAKNFITDPMTQKAWEYYSKEH